MICVPTPLRRTLAALAALSVLLAPTAQMAHAQAMVHEAVLDCAHPPMHHHAMPASAQHGSHHQHGATCCDLCPSGCQTVALPYTMAGLCAVIAVHAAEPITPWHSFVPRRPPHVLPFSLAPPVTSV